MSGIEKFDKNFRVAEGNKDGMCFIDCRQEPLRVYGLMMSKEHEGFTRMDEEVAKQTNEGVYGLCGNAAGGRVRFVTDSARIAVQAKYVSLGKMPHFPLTGSIGFDLYAEEDGLCRYRGTFTPPYDIKESYTSTLDLGGKKMREILIHFPLYSTVAELKIGLEEGAVIAPAKEYSITTPVVYYGSSITQGGCASRPGMCYQNIISRRLDCDHINLGFSGSARGEEPMREYLASLEMSAFVLDYDHNAPTADHLEATHELVFKAVREKHPDLPIVMASRPRVYLTEEEVRRREIIRTTYQNALDAGDKNVYFIEGADLMSPFFAGEGTVDYCHPTDLGFACMAQVFGDKLEEIFAKGK